MRIYIFFSIATIFLLSCSVSKDFQLTQLNNDKIEVNFIDYGETRQCFIFLRKKIELKNPYLLPAKVKLNYFIDGEQKDEDEAYPMDYGKDGNLYVIRDEDPETLYKIKIKPLYEKEFFYEIFITIKSFEFIGIYKCLEQYIPLAKHPIKKSDLTGETFEDTMVLVYKESFSEFKKKNPALADSLTKNSSFELEVLSPIKAKYRYDAQW